MNSVIGSLRANLGLDSAQFERGAKRSQSASDQLKANLAKMGAAAVAAGAALAAMAQRGAAEVDRLAKAGRRIDTTVTGMRALELAAGEAGVGVDSLADAVQNLDREVASGGKGAAAAMERLGISAKDLQGLEADQKLALIADRVKEMGLSTGEATALLREFGIRNRDMILLLMQGGDALRNARNDIQDYGLAMSRVDAAAIETANDQIGRLRLASQFLQQELARNLMPTFGMLAQSITDSLKEGGKLRAVLQAIADNARTFLTVVATGIVTLTAYKVALIAIAGAKVAATIAANGLRSALMKLGLPAIIIAAGLMVDQFVRLIEKTGGWGDAVSLLGEIASATWNGIIESAKAIPSGLASVWQNMKASFLGALSDMSLGFADFLQGIAGAGSGVPILEGMLDGVASAASRARNAARDFGIASADAGRASVQLRNEASSIVTNAFEPARAALEKLNAVMRGNATDTDNAADAANRLNEAMSELTGGGGGSGGAGGGVIEQAKSAFEQLGQTIQSSMEQGFMAIFDGTKKASGAFKDMARQILAELFRVLVVQRIVGSFGGGGILGAIGGAFGIGKNANGTTNWRGGLTMVGERGPELVNLPRGSQVIDAQNTAGRMGGGDVVQHFNFNLAANGDESVRRIVAQAAPQIVEAAKSGVLDARRRGGSYRAAFG
jgi:hypothetical protein